MARQMKWPWFSFQVDYDFLTFGTFRKQYWPKLQFFILLFYIIPTLYYAVIKFQKQQATQGNPPPMQNSRPRPKRSLRLSPRRDTQRDGCCSSMAGRI